MRKWITAIFVLSCFILTSSALADSDFLKEFKHNYALLDLDLLNNCEIGFNIDGQPGKIIVYDRFQMFCWFNHNIMPYDHKTHQALYGYGDPVVTEVKVKPAKAA